MDPGITTHIPRYLSSWEEYKAAVLLPLQRNGPPGPECNGCAEPTNALICTREKPCCLLCRAEGRLCIYPEEKKRQKTVTFSNEEPRTKKQRSNSSEDVIKNSTSDDTPVTKDSTSDGTPTKKKITIKFITKKKEPEARVVKEKVGNGLKKEKEERVYKKKKKAGLDSDSSELSSPPPTDEESNPFTPAGTSEVGSEYDASNEADSDETPIQTPTRKKSTQKHAPVLKVGDRIVNDGTHDRKITLTPGERYPELLTITFKTERNHPTIRGQFIASEPAVYKYHKELDWDDKKSVAAFKKWRTHILWRYLGPVKDF